MVQKQVGGTQGADCQQGMNEAESYRKAAGDHRMKEAPANWLATPTE